MFHGMTVEEYVTLQNTRDPKMYYTTYYETGQGLVNLTLEGRLVIIDKKGRRERDWYRDTRTGKPWFPKPKNFKSLVKQIIREEGGL